MLHVLMHTYAIHCVSCEEGDEPRPACISIESMSVYGLEN